MAPSVGPISIALEVPMTWAAEPIDIPLAIGCLTRISRRNFSANMLPVMPVTTMVMMVIGTLPPS